MTRRPCSEVNICYSVPNVAELLTNNSPKLISTTKLIVGANAEARHPLPAQPPSDSPNPKDQHQQDLPALGQEVLGPLIEVLRTLLGSFCP